LSKESHEWELERGKESTFSKGDAEDEIRELVVQLGGTLYLYHIYIWVSILQILTFYSLHLINSSNLSFYSFSPLS